MWRMMILLVLILAACGQAEVNVQIVDPPKATAIRNQQSTQQPNAAGFLYYEQTQSGLYFHYPAAWQIQEQSGHITMSGDGQRLVIEINTVASGSTPPATQSAETEDTSFVENDPVSLLGELHPTYLDEGAQRLYYTISGEHVPFAIANMRLSIWLESDTWPLAPSARHLADALVESVGFRWLVVRPSADQIIGWQHYTDVVTGLQFDYPPESKVIREAGAIVVTKDDAQLILALNSGPSGLPAGELRKGNPSHIWLNSAAIPRVYLLYEGRIKAVYYGPPVTPIPVGEHTLVMSVTGSSSTAYDTLDLSPDLLGEIDWIVTTLQP